ncbi:alpha-L-fucosidase [Microbacterium sp. 2MCAF23]|uniref:alpha-L-fucosidase n=1 Tax=Microbacterium sp. 2MCAF23 TaxID=3232985 RepID=UPI003F959D50
MTVLQIDGVVGLRDVGGIPAGSARVRPGRLYRSGALSDVDRRGAEQLRARVGRIVDLRSDDEVAEAPTVLADVEIVRLPLYHGSPRSFFLDGYDLAGIYRHLLAESMPELVAAIRAIAEGEAVLVHCTAGKDRTGLVIALALAAVGADRDEVVADYALTSSLIPEARRRATSERLRRAYPQSPHAAALATESPAAVMRDVLAEIDATHGSVRALLAAHGMTAEELSALDRALLDAEPCPPAPGQTPLTAHPRDAQTSPAVDPAPGDRMPAPADLTWFVDARLGMFVHWGLYSLAARHEWVKSRERLSDADYESYRAHFDPDRFDPRAWARIAREAGAGYVVLTAKHHDGFCLWDSALTDYTTMNTPFGRDAVAEFVAACRAEGLRVGLYYSLIDWHHESFPVDGTHPQRDDEEFKAATVDRDVRDYQPYLHGQVRELLTQYGRIDYLFFDFSYTHRPDYWGGKGAEDWDAENLLALVRELQPGIIVNDRLGIPGDIVTPEQYQPLAPMTRDGEEVPWEACQTLNGSWGYDRDNHEFKTAESLIRLLVDGVSKNGNLLLNIGPDGRGRLGRDAEEIFGGIGTWMDDHARAIRGAGPAPFTPPADVRYTLRGDRLYAHLFAWPFKHLHLPGLAGRVRYAQLMTDASELVPLHVDPDRVAQNTLMGGLPSGTLTLQLPMQRPDTAVPVVELFLTDDAIA